MRQLFFYLGCVLLLSLSVEASQSTENKGSTDTGTLNQEVEQLFLLYNKSVYNEPFKIESRALALINRGDLSYLQHPNLWVKVSAYYAESLIIQNKLNVLSDYFELHQEKIAEAPESGELSLLHGARGYVCLYQSSCEPKPYFLTAFQIATNTQSIDPLLTAYSHLSAYYTHINDNISAFRYALEGVSLAVKEKKPDHEASFYAILANIYQLMGSLQQSVVYNIRALTLYQQLNMPEHEETLKLAVIIDALTEAPDIAEKYISEILQSPQNSNILNVILPLRAYLAWKHKGDKQAALVFYQQLEDNYYDVLQHWEAVDYIFQFTDLCIELGMYTKASALLSAFESRTFPEITTISSEADYVLDYVRAKLAQKEGDYKRAYQYLESYRSRYQEVLVKKNSNRFASHELMIELETVRNDRKRLIAANHQYDDALKNSENFVDVFTYAAALLIIFVIVLALLLYHQVNLRKLLHSASKVDLVSGVFNRTYLQQLIDRRLKRRSTANAFVVIDLDNFKQVNDAYGHAVGDRVLALVGECLRDSFDGHNNLFGRWGGEEFLLVSWLNDGELLFRLEAFSRALRAIDIDQYQLNISASIGVATAPPKGHSSIDNKIEFADRLLYQSKQHGRDCITIGCAL